MTRPYAIDNEAQLLLAIAALQKDPKLSERRAAALYGVKRTSIQNRRAGRLAKRDSYNGRHTLTSCESRRTQESMTG